MCDDRPALVFQKKLGEELPVASDIEEARFQARVLNRVNETLVRLNKSRNGPAFVLSLANISSLATLASGHILVSSVSQNGDSNDSLCLTRVDPKKREATTVSTTRPTEEWSIVVPSEECALRLVRNETRELELITHDMNNRIETVSSLNQRFRVDRARAAAEDRPIVFCDALPPKLLEKTKGIWSFRRLAHFEEGSGPTAVDSVGSSVVRAPHGFDAKVQKVQDGSKPTLVNLEDAFFVVHAAAFSPSEQYIVVAGEGSDGEEIIVSAVAESKAVLKWKGPGMYGECVRFSRNSEMIACCDESGIISLIATESGETKNQFRIDAGHCSLVAFSNDDKQLFVGSGDKFYMFELH